MTHKLDASPINRRRLFWLSATTVAATVTGAFTKSSAFANIQAPQHNLKEDGSNTSNQAKSFVKLIALYRQPADVDRFERHYEEVHIPLVLKTPHLKEFRVTHYTASPTSNEPEFYMMAEEIYDSQADLEQARNSPELNASTRDMAALISEIQTTVITMIGEESQWP